MKISSVIVGLLAITVGFSEAAEPEKKWTSTTEFAAVIASGNAESSTHSGKIVLTRALTADTTLELHGMVLGAKSKDIVTAKQYNLGEKVSRKITDRTYLFEAGDWDKNHFLGYGNSYTLSVGAGRGLIDSPTNKLIAELGAGYVKEERLAPPDVEFGTARAYSKYTRVLSKTASFTQDAEYLHNLKERNGYRVAANSGLVATISTSMSMKFGYQLRYANQPAPGFKRNDALTSAALIIAY